MEISTLLTIDIQNDFLEHCNPTRAGAYLKTVAYTFGRGLQEQPQSHPRRHSLPMGYPESNRNNPLISAMAAANMYKGGAHHGVAILAPRLIPDEVVVTKRRPSTFTGTDLDILLRCYNSDHLIIAGLTTSGAVLSTIRQAQDIDFRITVLLDAFMDWDEEVHRFLTERVFAKTCEVITAAEFMAQLEGYSAVV